MNPIQDVFISYGRADSKEFARKLQERLLENTLNVWFDFKDIPPGVDYQRQIDDGINQADNFLFIISPHSVNSSYCQLEIQLAQARNKRIIPILHVEEIDRETWQHRTPQGTDQDWKAFVLEGKHTSFTNMPDSIRKINWINFREGIDDYDKAFKDLLETIERQRDYIRNHTIFLNKAIDWENNQRQSQYLLTGKDRQDAENWLQIRFQSEQPPCLPTDLHCEFITESKKNANNLMTQIFLSHSEEDADAMETIRRSLRRYGYTIWTNKTDIQTSEDFQQAINRGIEQADNLIYLLSPDSLQSKYCQYELNHAFSLNKRIIPILIRPVDEESTPQTLKDLQYIDYTQPFRLDSPTTTVDANALDDSQLIKILNQEASYYERHKVLLAKAIKWQQQHHNESLLLRGYNLEKFEAWLKLAQQRPIHGPTDLQLDYINASLDQPKTITVEVFISYSRADSDFARKINESLLSYGKTTWFDQESIASGTDFQQEIYHGIENAENFLFVISPNSIESPYCSDEVVYAQQLNKRIVPVLLRGVDTAHLPPSLASIQWIDFSRDDYFASFSELARTLDIDRQHVRSHTKWAQQAMEWEQRDRSKDLLLRGREFTIADHWLQIAETEHKYPIPTDLQKEFLAASSAAIQASEKRERRRTVLLRSLLGVASTVAVIAIGSSVMAFQNQRKAVQGQVRSLLATSEARYASGQDLEALLIGLEAAQRLQDTVATPELESAVINALQQSMDSMEELNTLEGHKNQVTDLSFSPDGLLATAGSDGTVKIWEKNGAFITDLEHSQPVRQMELSQDGQTLVTLSGDDEGDETHFTIWNREQETAITLKSDNAADESSVSYHASRLAISPDGRHIATSMGDSQVQLWNRDGQEEVSVDAGAYVQKLVFSADSQTLAIAAEKEVQFWSPSGETLGDPLVHEGWMQTVEFSPDGRFIVTSAADVVKLWQRDGTAIAEIPLGDERAGYDISTAFSPDSQLFAILSEGDIATVWTVEGEKIASLEGHEGWINQIAFSETVDQTATLATAGTDDTIKIWHIRDVNRGGLADADDQAIAATQTFTGHNNDVTALAFSPDGTVLASASDDRTVKLWQLDETDSLTKITAEADQSLDTYQIQLSPAAKVFTTMSAQGELLLWRTDGQLIKRLGQPDDYGSVTYSPDGQKLLLTTADQTHLLNTNGSLILSLLDSDNADVAFSPDSQYVIIAEHNGTARLWKTDGSHQEGILLSDDIGDNALISFSPDSTRFAISTNDRPVKLWDISGQALDDLAPPSQQWFTHVQFSPDSQQILTGVNYYGEEQESYGPIELWHGDGQHRTELIAATQISTLNNFWHYAETVFTADSRALLSVLHQDDGSEDLYLWQPTDAGDFVAKRLLTGNDGSIAIYMPPVAEVDNERINNVFVTVQEQGSVQLWNTDGQLLSTLLEEYSGYVQVEFSPMGDRVALINRDRLQIWDAQGQLIHEFDYSADFGTMTFSHDGQLLAVSTADNSVKLWNRNSPRSLTSLAGHSSQPNLLEFTQDGTQLLSASTHEILIRQLDDLADLDALITRACQEAGAYLVTHPQTLEHLEVCHPERDLLAAAATAWERRGEELAEQGRQQAAIAAFQKAADWRQIDLNPEEKFQQIRLIEEAKELAIAQDIDAATNRFERALKINPSLHLNPSVEARRIAAETLMDEGQKLVENDDLEAAIAKFQAAVDLDSNLNIDPELKAKQIKANALLDRSDNLVYAYDTDKILRAIEAYEEAETLVPGLAAQNKSYLSGNICWYGSVFEHADRVLPICEQAVSDLAEEKFVYLVSGLAKSLAGQPEDGLEDFEIALAWMAEQQDDDTWKTEFMPLVSRWVETIDAGDNPFTEAEIELLREY